ncbi:MAG: hypothetical protein Q9164_000329 [Protoblastenia rupestris]
MDTSAYLRSHGWLGPGHSLNPHSQRGDITKPIHIPPKLNVLGVGKKRHDAHAEQWWARAFDNVLEGINTSINGSKGRLEKMEMGNGEQAFKAAGTSFGTGMGKGGLYRNFVRGEGLVGTLGAQKNAKGDEPIQAEVSSANRTQSHEISVDSDLTKKKRRKRNHGNLSERASNFQTFESIEEVPARPVQEDGTLTAREEKRQRRDSRRENKTHSDIREREELKDAALIIPNKEFEMAAARLNEVRKTKSKSKSSFNNITANRMTGSARRAEKKEKRRKRGHDEIKSKQNR